MQCEAKLPNTAELRRLGLDIVEILDCLSDDIRDNEIRGLHKEKKARNPRRKRNRGRKSHWTVDSWEEAQSAKETSDEGHVTQLREVNTS